MRYGIVTANLGDYADPRVVVRLARATEAAGWEAFFVWDHLGFVRGVPLGDPWVILSAVAASTTDLMLGLAATPLARRRRPQVVAKSPERIAETVAETPRYRTTEAPLVVAVDGYSESGNSGLPHTYGAAGATWWLEHPRHAGHAGRDDGTGRSGASGDGIRSLDHAQGYSDKGSL